MLKSYDVEKIISDYRPDMIFNLSGPSSVYNSFANPQSTVDSIYGIFNNLVNACVKNNNFCSFFQPSSSEMFKDSAEVGEMEYDVFHFDINSLETYEKDLIIRE